MSYLINLIIENHLSISIGIFMVLSFILIQSDIGKSQQKENKKNGIIPKMNTFW
jgi:hypothetical protein